MPSLAAPAALARRLLLPLLALSACGEPAALLVSADGELRLLASIRCEPAADDARTAVAAALAQHATIDLVWAHAEVLARGAAEAARTARRAQVRVMSVCGAETAARQLVASEELAVALVPDPGADAAVDLALLAIHRVPHLPTRVALGGRSWSRASLAAGGAPFLAPGDVAMADLRRRHADALTTTPTIDVVWRLGLVAPAGDGGALAALVRSRVEQQPQLELVLPAGPGADAARQVRELLQQGCHAILVGAVTDDAVTSACRAALQQEVAVIALGLALPADACSSRIGADDHAVGRAAGHECLRLLAGTGNVLELRSAAERTGEELHRGFVDALGLGPPR